MSARYRITAPAEGANCTVAGVLFEDSIAETDSENAVNYFRRHGYGVEELGPRDAAVDPNEGDFLPPVGAGTADPHGPEVAAPGIHAGANPGPIVPGPLGELERQQERETEAARRVLVEQEPVPEVTADLAAADGDQDQDQADPPAGNASQSDWADWVIATNPDLDEAKVRAMKRDDLREKYGPKPE